MELQKLACTGYKPFRDEVEIELEPLTILFGRNNSGKSALLRVPRLLLRALSLRARSGFPLDVDELSFGESFRDLVHQRLVHGHIDLSLTLRDGEEQFALAARVQNISESSAGLSAPAEYQVVSSLHLENPPLDLVWDGKRGRPPSYVDWGPLEFRGLLPETKRPTRLPVAVFEDWRERVRDFEDRVSHLGAYRVPIAGTYERGTPRPLNLDGSGAPGWLAEDSGLAAMVGDWFEGHMNGWRLSLDSAAGAYRCVLRRGDVEVNLADCGDGMQQVLPVVVRQYRHARPNQGSFLDLVEEPELHLHPAAHAPLADLFLNTAASGRGQVLVETHSENLLLRIRRRIAEGADAALIAVYWVEDRPDGTSSVCPIRILADGEVDVWPQGVFSETYDEVRALRRAARARSSSETTQ